MRCNAVETPEKSAPRLSSTLDALVKPTLFVTAASALFLSACATLGTFQEVDDNHDGVVSRDEASHSEALASLFTTADDNRDGVLDEEEYALVYKVITKKQPSTTQRRKMMTERGGPTN